MRRTWLILLMLIALGSTAYVVYRYTREPNPMRLSCTIGHDLRAYKLNPERIVRAYEELDPLLNGEVPLAVRIEHLKGLVCNTDLLPESRLVALDFLFENFSILEVLRGQESLHEAWTNAVTGSSGTVILVETTQVEGYVCTVVDYPSMMPGISETVVSSARERYCKDAAGEDWFSHEILDYRAYRVDQRSSAPKKDI